MVIGETPPDMVEALRNAMLKEGGAQAVFLALRMGELQLVEIAFRA